MLSLLPDLSSPVKTRRAGRVLIMVGVIAWLPYGILLATGAEPLILPFLAVHLAGVLSGTFLRSRADRLEGCDPTYQIGRRRIPLSWTLIGIGLAAWVPYFYLHHWLGQQISMAPFLTVHLVGILGGAAMRVSVLVQRRRQAEQARS